MTVHAAKGLEFPVVFVVNLERGAGSMPPPVRVVIDGGHGAPAVSIGAFQSEADEEERVRDREETKRLLYVASTRARDRLYLGAQVAQGRFKPGGGSLGEVLPESLQRLFVSAAAEPSATDVVRWPGPSGRNHLVRVCHPPATPGRGRPGSRPLADEHAGEASRFEATVIPPVWESAAVTALTGAGDVPGRVAGAGPGPGADQVVGRLVHRLLQAELPADVAEDEVAERAAEIAAHEDIDDVHDAPAVVRQVARTFLAIRSNAEVRALLESGTVESEVPFSLRLDPGVDEPTGPPRVVRGSIDALVTRHDESLVVLEFKTGRPAAWHEVQLGLYVEAVRRLYPLVPVSGRVVYPDG